MDREFTITILLEPAEEGGFLVLVPALPEVVTHGDTEREALAMAEDAIRLAIEYRKEQGEAMPAATTPELRQVKIALPA
jgi:antitoxin HicB